MVISALIVGVCGMACCFVRMSEKYNDGQYSSLFVIYLLALINLRCRAIGSYGHGQSDPVDSTGQFYIQVCCEAFIHNEVAHFLILLVNQNVGNYYLEETSTAVILFGVIHRIVISMRTKASGCAMTF